MVDSISGNRSPDAGGYSHGPAGAITLKDVFMKEYSSDINAYTDARDKYQEHPNQRNQLQFEMAAIALMNDVSKFQSTVNALRPQDSAASLVKGAAESLEKSSPNKNDLVSLAASVIAYVKNTTPSDKYSQGSALDELEGLLHPTGDPSASKGGSVSELNKTVLAAALVKLHQELGG